MLSAYDLLKAPSTNIQHPENNHVPKPSTGLRTEPSLRLVLGVPMELGCWNLVLLQSQSFWNQNAIEQIEKPLHKQRKNRRRNRALENSHVIVQIKATQDWLAQTSGSD